MKYLLSVLLFFIIFSVSGQYSPVFAHHCDGLEPNSPECIAQSGGQYCDGQERHFDSPLGNHPLLETCSADKLCVNETVGAGEVTDRVTVCLDATPTAGGACQYPEEQSDGIYLCHGTFQTQAANPPLVCRFDTTGAVAPACEKDTDLPGTTSTTTTSTDNNLIEGAGTPVDSSNYKAPQHADYTIQNFFHGTLCQLTGMSPVGECIGQKKEGDRVTTYLYNRVPGGGAVGGLSTAVASLYNPPTSTAQYVANLGQNLGFVKPAYAQVSGSGESIIKPIFKLWEITRNIAYIAFTLVFVAVGFMIMFRQKLSQQAVVSVQAALPGLVVGLILVTFSYFIAALIIDIAFLGVQVVAQVFIQSGMANVFDPQSLATDSNAFHLFTSSFRFGENFTDISHGASGLLGTPSGNEGVGRVMAGLTGALIGYLSTGFNPVGAGIAGTGAALGPELLGLIVPVILIIALIIQFFWLLFKLINAYVMLLVTTVTGPFIILAASIPGQGGRLAFWWKAILANALIFPAVFAAFLFAGVILATPATDWNASPPLFGGIPTTLLRLIIAYGIILGIPAIPDLVKSALGVKDIAGFGQTAQRGLIFGLGAATPPATGAGRFGIKFAATKTDAAATGSFGNRINALIRNRFGNSQWFNR